ncbi:hypothetical protein HMPREF1008_00265 [Olsenella sp. oral taxon 809 str. F0356]|nr:hypothetical protein HMPREF1008_00265 [Olsenella sp. oral taxon 809 str. F0356]
MAEQGPTGDRASPGEFIVLHRFMMKELGLSGVPLLVYARIYGFNSANLEFFESKTHLADFLSTTDRSIYRAFKELLDKGLIKDEGPYRHPAGIETKRYSVVWSSVPARARGPDPDETSPPDKLSPPEILSGQRQVWGDETSGRHLTNCQPIRKADNEDFR